jgi:hypothetical protein
VDGFNEETTELALDALFTVCAMAGDDVLPAKFPSPPYCTVIWWLAVASKALMNVAWPPLSVPVPIIVAPSKKDTVPVGVPAPGALAVTDAVNVTDCPKTLGFTDEPTLLDVVSLFTTCEMAGVEVLPLKLALPPYVAVNECVAVASDDACSVATPALLRLPVPMDVAPSRNVTVPVGSVTPDAGVTVAVSVIGCPKTAGFANETSTVVVPVNAAEFTTSLSTGEDVLPLKVALPVYTAVMGSVPTGREEIISVACPELSELDPIDVPLSLKVTVPVGVTLPEVALTVAVKVICWPDVDGFKEETTDVCVPVVIPPVTV